MLSLSPVTEAVIFFAAMVTLTSAILAAIYFLLRDPQAAARSLEGLVRLILDAATVSKSHTFLRVSPPSLLV